MVDRLLRAAIAIVALAEAASLLVGAALHLGYEVPAPFVEPAYLPAAVLEGVAGVILLYAALGVAFRAKAWHTAVIAHVVGVGAVVFGILAQVTGRMARATTETGHHPRTLLLLIAVLVGLALPPVRGALGGGRRRTRHRYRQASYPESRR